MLVCGQHRTIIGEKEPEDVSTVANATLLEIQALISLFLIGERFFDGHWGNRIENGHVRRLLERLEKIGKDMRDTETTQ